MKAKYNDYEKAVYGYLINYRRFQGQIANLTIQIQGVQEEIDSIAAAPIAKYGADTAGGFSGLSPVEQLVERRQKLEAKLPMLQADLRRVKNLVESIDTAINMLPEIDQRIVRLKYIENNRWLYVALETKYSERRCQDIAERAIRDITDMMFPEVAEGQQRLRFVFFERSTSCGQFC